MDAGSTSPSPSGARRPGSGLAVAAAGVLAYWPLLQGVLAGNAGLEGWLFRPSQLPLLLVLAVAGWLLWRRRRRWLAAPGRPAPLLAGALGLLGTAAYCWALMTGTVDLLLPAASAHLFAVAAVLRGGSGCRAVMLPALVLLLGVPLPTPLLDEVVWRLQLGSASGAGWLLGVMGSGFFQSGVMLASPAHSFQVIDSCSGLNGILTLTLVALIVRELHGDAGARLWLVVLAAPLLGFVLNVVRVAYVAASDDPEALAGVQGDHTPQGLAVLALGTLALYGVGWLLARGKSSHAAAPSNAQTGRRVEAPVLITTAGGLATLAVLSLVLPGFRTPDAGRPERFVMPAAQSGWKRVGPAPTDPFFIGALGGGVQLRYEFEARPAHTPEVVDVLIGFESPLTPGTSRLLSSQLRRPGPAWDLVETRSEYLWSLGRQADRVLASRRSDGQHAVVYMWRLRDGGLWRESLRSLLALEASPFRRGQPRAVVRLVAYSPHDGQLMLDRAKQRLDRFISAFLQELSRA